ncbi:hypothetical protein ADK60_08730 [Streptomyces sp. XY431]|uniref:hypothetical protein n=1 Tax=Streptomyces sp. XY431 TaxID=1415562 RepID=UPI0006AF1918|nr:hypothetical protein [Streptomyces sp. XY431]KOV35774.1 hypothetical protein ADK60_08730 [Streptomyces sp. XY431]
MDELRFDKGIGTFAVDVAENSLMILKAAGTHCLQFQLAVHIPKSEKVGSLILLETDLFAPQELRPKAWLGSATHSLAFVPGGVQRPTLRFLLTSAQILALEAQRNGDLHLELQIRAVLPQATGYPGGSEATVHIGVAESRWRQQLENLGPALAFEYSIPFPAGDDPRQEAVDHLRSAHRRLGGNDIDGAILDVRRALEYVEENSGWHWPGQRKDKEQRTQDERWAWIRSALADQASGALHKDATTKTFTYTRAEAEVLVAMTTALLRLVS